MPAGGILEKAMGKRLNAAQIARTNQQRTGIHNVPDRVAPGKQAPKRDCAHFGCRPPFHNPSCETLGIFAEGPGLERPFVDAREAVDRVRNGRRGVDQ